MHLHYLQLAWLPFEEITVSEEVSKLTDRYQTTVPSGVRRHLQLGKGDQIRYRTEASGRVYIEPVRNTGEDPALGAFLDLLEADIQAHPERLKSFDGPLHARLEALVGGIQVDLDAPLSEDDE